jgi:hypothetical protein
MSKRQPMMALTTLFKLADHKLGHAAKFDYSEGEESSLALQVKLSPGETVSFVRRLKELGSDAKADPTCDAAKQLNEIKALSRAHGVISGMVDNLEVLA